MLGDGTCAVTVLDGVKRLRFLKTQFQARNEEVREK